jgi:hypothetical protein
MRNRETAIDRHLALDHFGRGIPVVEDTPDRGNLIQIPEESERFRIEPKERYTPFRQDVDDWIGVCVFFVCENKDHRTVRRLW